MTPTTGAINGSRHGQHGAVVPGVTVSLSGPSLMTARTTITEEEGAYRFSAVSLGDHTLTFQLAGFGTVVREDIHVEIGFTATVNVELRPATIADRVTVSGAAPVVNVSSTVVTTHFDSDTLASLPGARDFFALAANTPGVALSKMDVGGTARSPCRNTPPMDCGRPPGSTATRLKAFVSAGPTGERQLLLRLRVLFGDRDYRRGSDAAMPVPGTLGQYVSKSGGNAYHGGLYADFQNDALEATNIDDSQSRSASRRARPRRARRKPAAALSGFQRRRGRYLKKDRAWWYGASALPRSRSIPLAARHGCHARRGGRDRQDHLPAVSTSEAVGTPARNVPAVELSRRRHAAAHRDQ